MRGGASAAACVLAGLLASGAAGCKRRAAPVATAEQQAALKSLQARAAAKDLPAAESLSKQLLGTPAEPEARAAMAELYTTLNDPRAPAETAQSTEWFATRGHHARAAQSARLQARLAWMAARFPDALKALERSLAEAERAGDRQLFARALLGEFLVLYELGDLPSAGRVLGKAETNMVGVDVETQALAALNRGLLSDAEGNRSSARAAFERVLQLTRGTSLADINWGTHLNLLELALTAEDITAAARARAAAEPLYESGGFKQRPQSRAAWGFYSAQLARLQNRPQDALVWLDPLAAEDLNQNWKWKIALERGRALLALGRRQEAAAALETSAAIVESMRGEQADAYKSWAFAGRRAPFVALFDLYAGQGDGSRAVEVMERTQGRMFLEAFSARTAGLPAEGDVLFAGATRRAAALKQLYPALRSSTLLSPAPLPWSDLRRRLGRDPVLSFFEGARDLYLVSVIRQQVRVHRLPLSLSDLRPLVARFLERPGDQALAETLSAALLPPAVLPAAGSRVHLVPTSLLGRIPFGALRARGRYLAELYELAHVPSLNALVALRRPGRDKGAPAMVLANAGGDLPAAEAEARAVAVQVAAGPRLYIGAQASSQRLADSGPTSLLHLAVHSGVDAAGPWLALSDRRIRAQDILAWGLRAEVVVLASCASAATPDPGLWGSLAAAFLAGGSRSVVGSLWSTKDDVSRRFLEDFYAAGGAVQPAVALTRTQRAWSAQGRPTADWAGYAFFGAHDVPGRWPQPLVHR